MNCQLFGSDIQNGILTVDGKQSMWVSETCSPECNVNELDSDGIVEDGAAHSTVVLHKSENWTKTG